MKLVSSAQMREMDRRTMVECEVSGEVLMDRAGYGVARAVRELAHVAGFGDHGVQVFAGRGNNGGDAFAAARYLHEWGASVEVWIAGERAAVGGDALTHLSRLRGAEVPVNELPTQEDCDDLDIGSFECGIVVDGILGIGITGPARGPAAGAIRCVNDLGEEALVVAVDVPSGLNADTGRAAGDAVRADLTVTMGFPKRGLAEDGAAEYVGSVEVCDIGIPLSMADPIESDMELITDEEVRRAYPRRPRAAHKGSFGHVLLVGGSPGFAGAIGLAARSAVRAGAGLVSVLTPSCVAPVIAAMAPEAMVHAGAQTDAGCLAADCLDRWGRDLNAFSSILLGPGMRDCPETRAVVEKALAATGAPLVLDADGLNAFSGDAGALKARGGGARLVLTPHPGEAARLLGASAANVQEQRRECARRLAAESGATVVLKGAGTLVAAVGETLRINLTGNPGMATGGSGDVLAGMLAAVLGQGARPFDAASAAVHLHGLAGDLAAWGACQACMNALDIIESLPAAMRTVSPR